MRWIGLLLAIVLVALVAPSRTLAQPELDPAARAEARRITQRATRDYEQQRFQQALEGYQRAYAVYPVPGLLFNIAQCHRGLGQHRLAIQRFEQYLEEQPDSPNRALVLDLVAESRAQLARHRAQEEEGRASRVEGALSAELERQQAALAELERTQHELEQAREAGEEQRERERARYEAALAELETARRELEEARQRVELERASAPLAAPDPTPEPPAHASAPAHEQWWFWTLIATGVVLIAGGITLGVVLTREPELPDGSLGTIDLR